MGQCSSSFGNFAITRTMHPKQGRDLSSEGKMHGQDQDLMDEHELRELIGNHEADRVEITTSTTNTDKFSEAVCAFANDLPNHGRPGHLIIGVDDSGRIAGLEISDELLRNLGGLRSDGNVQPLPDLTVEKLVTS